MNYFDILRNAIRSHYQAYQNCALEVGLAGFGGVLRLALGSQNWRRGSVWN
jgi:hypothetical protein